MSELEALKKENEELKKKLATVKAWMERWLKSQVNAISKKKINKMTWNTKESFLKKNIEEIISKQIRDLFWDIMLMNIPSAVIENIISAEINLYNLKLNPESDWFSVISSYHKALDVIIESYISKWFRKYCKKSGQIYLRKNDLLEKSLHSVVNKWFILSAWRLFHILKTIKEESKMYDYLNAFKDYLNKFYYIKDILLSENFYNRFEKLVWSEVLWKKRHIWNINLEETLSARKLLIWDFQDKESLIYQLIETQNTNI